MVVPVTEGIPMRCAFCHHPLTPETAWKGTADRFYCSEFCDDSETVIPARSHPPKEEIDQLERLLALRHSSYR
jgi:hypothetical protein